MRKGTGERERGKRGKKKKKRGKKGKKEKNFSIGCNEQACLAFWNAALAQKTKRRKFMVLYVSSCGKRKPSPTRSSRARLMCQSVDTYPAHGVRRDYLR